jgi:hypothetical protein
VLEAIIYGGYTKFPLGIYTVDERNALERSDNRTPEDQGATFPDTDVAISRRYGLKMHILPDNTDATLRAALSKPGYAFALAGQLSNLPDGDYLRRHQPTYTGGHALCVITLGNGKVLWLDPLAPAKYAGDTTTVDKAMLFAWTGNAYSRFVRKDEYVEGTIDMWVNDIKPVAPFYATVGKNVNIRTSPELTAASLSFNTKNLTPSVLVIGHVEGDTASGSNDWYVYALNKGGLRVVAASAVIAKKPLFGDNIDEAKITEDATNAERDKWLKWLASSPFGTWLASAPK